MNFHVILNFETEKSNECDCNIDTWSPCDQWLYSSPILNDTMVSEYDLVCDKTWIRDSIFGVGNVGLAVGAFIGGPMTEYFGRKFTMMSITLVTVVCLAVQAFSNNLIVVLVFWTLVKIASQVRFNQFSIILRIISDWLPVANLRSFSDKIFGVLIICCGSDWT